MSPSLRTDSEEGGAGGSEASTMFPFEEGYVLIDGSKTWVVDSRSPKTKKKGTVVLLHGLHMDCTIWFHVLMLLWTSGYRVVIYDLKGHGSTACPWWGYTTEDQAKDLIALVEELQLNDVHVGGLSMGGLIAARAVQLRPDLFRSLILMNSFLATFPFSVRLTMAVHSFSAHIAARSQKDDLYRVLFSAAFVEDSANKQQIKTWRRRLAAITLYSNFMSRLGLGYTPSDFDLEALGAKPILLLTGSEDIVCPPSRCHALAEELGPKAEVQVLQGLAHGPPMQDPAKVHDALLAFLEKQGAQDDDREGGAEGSEESEESDDNEEAGEEKKEN